MEFLSLVIINADKDIIKYILPFWIFHLTNTSCKHRVFTEFLETEKLTEKNKVIDKICGEFHFTSSA